MSSSSASSLAGPSLRPSASVPIPQVDLRALARTTRKTLERLVPFCLMRTSSSTVPPRLSKIISKINRYTNLIDSSMLCHQLGYQLANNCMILCDPELSVGLSAPVKRYTRAVDRGRSGAWTPVGNGRFGAGDAGVFGRQDARELAGKGHELALKVKEGFSSISQEVYKIAATTKDDMLIVAVPPDPTHSEVLKIHLKDVGTNLVASLSLLSEFSKAVVQVTDWWSSVKDDLASEESSVLLPISQDGVAMDSEKFAWWSEMKEDFQEYYDVINVVHLRFPELLPSSSVAWKSVTSARSRAPSCTGHSNDPLQSESNPVIITGATASGTKGRGRGARLVGFMLGWKCLDKERRHEESRPRRGFSRGRESKERESKEREDKKKKEVENKSDSETERKEEKNDISKSSKAIQTDDENTTRNEPSQSSSSTYSRSSASSAASLTSPKPTKDEKPDLKLRMKRSYVFSRLIPPPKYVTLDV